MGLDEESFFTSSLARAVYLIDKWAQEKQALAGQISGAKGVGNRQQPKTARSIKEVLNYYGH